MTRSRRQPSSSWRIDWDHPLAQGLAFVIIPGLLLDLVTGQKGTLNAGTTRQGGSIICSGTTGNGINFGNAFVLAGQQNCTVAAIAQGTTTNSCLYGENSTAGNDLFKLEDAQGGAQFTYRTDTSGATVFGNGNVQAADGRRRLFAAIKNGSAFSAVTALAEPTGIPNPYVNDDNQYYNRSNTNGTSDNTFTNGSVTRSIGYSSQDGNQNFNGRIDIIVGWKRAVSDADLKLFASNYYAFIVAPDEGNNLLKMAKYASAMQSIGATYAASIAELLSALDSSGATFFTNAQVAEILSAAESSSASGGMSSASVESIAPVEGSSVTTTVSSANTESLTALETTAIGSVASSASIMESGSASETIGSVNTTNGQTSELISAVESVAPQGTGAAAIAENASAVESLRTVAQSSSAVAETLTLSDQETSVLQALSALADNVAVSDQTYVGSAASLSAIAEAATLADAMSSQGTLNAGSVETLSITEAHSAKAQFVSAWLDSVGLADQSFVAGLATSSATSDSVVITDTTSALQIAVAQNVDSLSLAELLSGYLLGTVGPVTITPDQIPQARWIKFDGDVRVIAFEGTGRVIAFDGDVRTVVFEGTNRIVSF